MAAKFQVSQETNDKIASFTQSDLLFKQEWEKFEQAHAQTLEYLDKLRENRNALLDDAKRSLRTEAGEADITDTKFIKAGPFSVQKKWSGFYVPEKFVALLKDKGLYDSALSAKVVAEKIEVAKLDQAQAFLTQEGVLKDFEECEDGQEITPAVSGPKPIPAFGAEQKEASK